MPLPLAASVDEREEESRLRSCHHRHKLPLLAAQKRVTEKRCPSSITAGCSASCCCLRRKEKEAEGEGTIVELRRRHRTASTSTGGRREPPLLPLSRGEEISREGRWRFMSTARWNATPRRHHGCRGSFAGDRRSCELPPQPTLAAVLRSPEGEKDFSHDANEPLPAMPLLTAAALPANRLPSTCLEVRRVNQGGATAISQSAAAVAHTPVFVTIGISDFDKN
nr:hypothetical protein Iba_chr01dCG0920 [Ipomoea batatas]